jgi:serine/threonine protein kinase
VSGAIFECLSRYSLIKAIGKGAYGTVCAADDMLTSEKVAIKKISKVFESTLDARRTLREMRLLRCLNHENIIRLRDVFPPATSSVNDFSDLYLVYDLLDTDLHQIIRSPQLLSPDHIKFLTYQLIRGLKYLHSAGIIHRDLKPSNLLINANCDLRICDFGLVSCRH